MKNLRRIACMVVAWLASACEDVPALTFDGLDAGLGPDADAAAAPTDAGDDGGCSVANVTPGVVCCGAVTCQGATCAAKCGACSTACRSPGDVCCPKNNNVVCMRAGSICH